VEQRVVDAPIAPGLPNHSFPAGILLYATSAVGRSEPDAPPDTGRSAAKAESYR